MSAKVEAEGSAAAMAAMPARAGIQSARAERWPRLAIFYYLLAALNISAIAFSLFLGQRVIRAFEANTRLELAFDHQNRVARAISDAAMEAQAAVIDGLRTHKVETALGTFQGKLSEVRREIGRDRLVLGEAVTETSRKRMLQLLVRIETTLSGVESHGTQALRAVGEGKMDRAMNAVAAMQSRYATLRRQLQDFNQTVALLRTGHSEATLRTANNFRRYENLIGGLIIVVILSVLVYGHFMGRLVRRKYRELAEAHGALGKSHADAVTHAAEVQSVNENMAKLNRQLADNMIRIQAMQSEAIKKGKLAQLGQLTATVAHELRNPLGTVKNSLFLLERKVKGKGLGIETQIERIAASANRCDDIINQLLDFSRSRRPDLVIGNFDMWLEDALEEELQRLPAAVSVHFAPGLGESQAAFDHGRMNRVVANLLANACEAMVGKGDERGTPRSREPRISVSTRATARGVEMTIADNGPGISAENMRRILEPLFTTKNFGTGLGLPAVEKIMEEHGGGIEVSSVEGEGARFTIWFPQRPGSEPRAA